MSDTVFLVVVLGVPLVALLCLWGSVGLLALVVIRTQEAVARETATAIGGAVEQAVGAQVEAVNRVLLTAAGYTEGPIEQMDDVPPAETPAAAWEAFEGFYKSVMNGEEPEPFNPFAADPTDTTIPSPAYLDSADRAVSVPPGFSPVPGDPLDPVAATTSDLIDLTNPAPPPSADLGGEAFPQGDYPDADGS